MWPFSKKSEPKKPRFARSYTGAKASRLLADFLSPSSSADKELRPALRTLRDRSRQLARNEPYANRALQIFKTNIIGEPEIAADLKRRARQEQDSAVDDLVEQLLNR